MKTIEDKQTATPLQTTAPAKIERRYDVDWLRVVAVFSVIALHSAVIFSSGQFNVKHVQPSLTVDTIQTYLSVWIIPLLFVLAGAATKFALDRRTPKEYCSERVKRLLVPLVIWLFVPAIAATVFGWDFLFQLPGNPRLAFTVVGTGHLWFIGYLFGFSLIALPLFVFLRKPTGVRIISWLANICEKPGVIFLLAIPLMEISPADNDNLLLQLFYLFYFIYGFIIFSDARFGRAIDKQTWYALAAGIALVIMIMFMAETKMHIDSRVDRILTVFNRWCWVIAFLGLGHRFLNRTNRVLRYLTEASYPIYILHFLILALIGYYIAGLGWPVELKYLTILSLAVAATVLAYDLLVKRTNVTRVLFGMKPKRALTPRNASANRKRRRTMNISDVMERHQSESTMTKLARLLLICGILSSLLRVATDILAAMWYPGYSYIDQTMSQLAAIGAPTRPFQIALLAVYDALVIAFGIGVWGSAGRKRSLRVTGILLVIFGAIGLVELPFPQTAMQLHGGLAAETMHIIVTSVGVLLIVLFIGFGAAAHGKGFRLYSIATILTLLVFGALAGLQAPQAAQFSAPWMGVLERVSYYSYLLWILVFAVVRLRVVGKESQDHINHSMKGLQV